MQAERDLPIRVFKYVPDLQPQRRAPRPDGSHVVLPALHGRDQCSPIDRIALIDTWIMSRAHEHVQHGARAEQRQSRAERDVTQRSAPSRSEHEDHRGWNDEQRREVQRPRQSHEVHRNDEQPAITPLGRPVAHGDDDHAERHRRGVHFRLRAR